MGLALFPEYLGGRIEGTEDPADLALRHAERGELAGDRGRIRALGRSEATIASAPISRADRAAASLRDGAKAGCAMRDHHADGAAQFAFMADTVPGDRWLAPNEEGFDDLQQLPLIDRAAAQFEIDRHMRADRRRGGERLHIFRVRINC